MLKKFDEQPFIAIIVAGILAFGLLIPSLGFFQDDWHFIHYGSAAGARGMLEFLTMDGRPSAFWVYATLYPLLGFSPLPWHVLSLTLRLVTVLLAFSTLTTLFPNRTRTNLLASFFFLLYPFFTLQPQAVVYTEHWMAFALFFASLLLMLRAIQNPKRWFVYTALAILAETLHLFTVEYFVGLELLRPFVIWMMIYYRTKTSQFLHHEEGAFPDEAVSEPEAGLLREDRPRNDELIVVETMKPTEPARQSPNPLHPPVGNVPLYSGYAQAVKRIALAWLPYFIILLLFLYWRTSFLGALDLRNNPADALSLQTVLVTAQNFLADISLVLVSSWFKLIDPTALELTRARNFVVIAITLATAFLAYLYSRSLNENTEHATRKPSYALTGALAFLLGLAPSYAANFIIHLKLEPWNGRFALAALPGAGMLIAVAFESLFTSEKTRRVMFAVLIGLLIGYHNRVGFDFKTSWEKQVKLYEQLTWRAPFIEPGTAIITDQEILSYMGDYPTSFALNTIYDTKSLRPSPYWFFAMSENLNTDADSLIEGVELSARKYASTFEGNSRDSLIIVFEPEKNQCLWIVRPEDAAYRGLPDQIKIAAQTSNLSRIPYYQKRHSVLFVTIVPENTASWCFYYQHADQARQYSDWKQVISLWNLAEQGGYTPGHGFEYIPFIQAFAHTGDWEQALALTKQSNRVSANMKTILCPVWEELAASTPESAERDMTVNEAMNLLGCQ